MTDLASRFANNPIVRPSDVKPSVPGWEVACAFNPGAFSFQGRIGLVLRVAERPPQRDGEVDSISFSDGKLKVDTFKVSDPDLNTGDSRVFSYQGIDHLTTISHFRLAWSDDGENFQVEDKPMFAGDTDYETLGIATT